MPGLTMPEQKLVYMGAIQGSDTIFEVRKELLIVEYFVCKMVRRRQVDTFAMNDLHGIEDFIGSLKHL